MPLLGVGAEAVASLSRVALDTAAARASSRSLGSRDGTATSTTSRRTSASGAVAPLAGQEAAPEAWASQHDAKGSALYAIVTLTPGAEAQDDCGAIVAGATASTPATRRPSHLVD